MWNKIYFVFDFTSSFEKYSKSSHVLRKERITRISTRLYPKKDDEIKLNNNLTTTHQLGKNDEFKVRHKHKGNYK